MPVVVPLLHLIAAVSFLFRKLSVVRVGPSQRSRPNRMALRSITWAVLMWGIRVDRDLGKQPRKDLHRKKGPARCLLVAHCSQQLFVLQRCGTLGTLVQPYLLQLLAFARTSLKAV